jgi:hypothetical protein
MSIAGVTLGLERAAGSVAAELTLDADHVVLDVEIADRESERLADPQPRGEQKLEQAAVQRAL